MALGQPAPSAPSPVYQHRPLVLRMLRRAMSNAAWMAVLRSRSFSPENSSYCPLPTYHFIGWTCHIECAQPPSQLPLWMSRRISFGAPRPLTYLLQEPLST